MNIKDITGKFKETVGSKITKEDKDELKENKTEKNFDEEKIISDEIEEDNEIKEGPMKVKTMFVKSEATEAEENNRKKIKDAVKIISGIGIIAVTGIAALLINSKKKK